MSEPTFVRGARAAPAAAVALLILLISQDVDWSIRPRLDSKP